MSPHLSTDESWRRGHPSATTQHHHFIFAMLSYHAIIQANTTEGVHRQPQSQSTKPWRNFSLGQRPDFTMPRRERDGPGSIHQRSHLEPSPDLVWPFLYFHSEQIDFYWQPISTDMSDARCSLAGAVIYIVSLMMFYFCLALPVPLTKCLRQSHTGRWSFSPPVSPPLYFTYQSPFDSSVKNNIFIELLLAVICFFLLILPTL